MNRYGNRDLGLAQCSDYCRRTIAAMAAAGELDFSPTEADYLDPRIGSLIATVWFERELRRSAGDVSLAIRAYHRGLEAPRHPEEYLTARIAATGDSSRSPARTNVERAVAAGGA